MSERTDQLKIKMHEVVTLDFSKVEARILSEEAKKILAKAKEFGVDVHTMKASEIFGVGFDEVTPQQRRHAKVVKFGILYGGPGLLGK